MDKKHILTVFAVLCIAAVCAQTAQASLGLTVPFGGKVMEPVPGDTCSSGNGPFMQSGTGTNDGLPFFYPSGRSKAPHVGGWVLGLYSSVVDVEDCVDAAGNPVPVNKVTLYGTS